MSKCRSDRYHQSGAAVGSVSAGAGILASPTLQGKEEVSSALHLHFLPKSKSVIGRQRDSEQPHPLPAPALDNVLFMGPNHVKR